MKTLLINFKGTNYDETFLFTSESTEFLLGILKVYHNEGKVYFDEDMEIANVADSIIFEGDIQYSFMSRAINPGEEIITEEYFTLNDIKYKMYQEERYIKDYTAKRVILSAYASGKDIEGREVEFLIKEVKHERK